STLSDKLPKTMTSYASLPTPGKKTSVPRGMNTLSGLNKTMERTISRTNLKKSVHRIDDLPIRRRYSIGIYSTVKSEQIMHRVIVVVNEKPVGNRGTNTARDLRRNTRIPELRSGIACRARKFAIFPK